MDERTTGFVFSDVVEEAVDRSGGQTATANDILKVRRSLTILTNRWMAQGYNTWRIRHTTIPISGASPEVPLPACVDDVIQVNSILSQGSEAGMKRIPASEYQQLTAKMTQGRPAQYWLQRTVPPVLHIFPIGRSDGPSSLSVAYVEAPEAFQRYGDVDDVPGRWLEALVLGVALELARKRPPYDEALIARLKVEAAEAEDLAQRADRDRSNYRVRIS